MKKTHFFKSLWLWTLFLVASVANAQHVAKIGTTEYTTLADAVAAVPTDGTETTITMIADEMITTNAGVVIPATKNIVLDLAGHSILGIARQSGTSYVISNSGTLTINDSSEQNTGAIIGNALLPDETSIPGYASNTIRNYGHLAINNCFIESKGTGFASYAIDNDAENAQWQTTPDHIVSLTINGGKFRSNTSQTIRMYLDTEGVYENVVSINNADMGSFWMQDNANSQAAKGTLNIDNSSFIYSVGVGYYGRTQNLKVTATNNSFTSLYYTLWYPTEGTNSLMLKNNKYSGTFNSLMQFPVLTDGLYGRTSSSNNYYGGTQYLVNSVAEGYELIDNTDPATKDTYPYMVAPTKKVHLEVDDEVVVTTNPEATTEEQDAAKAAVEALGNNENVTADDATNVAEMEDVHSFVISVVRASVDTKTADGVTATITQVTYDVQPWKNDQKVNMTAQPINFRLPVPENFEGYVKVSHKHNDVIVTTYEKIQGEGINKYVALSSDKFSEWTLEYVNPNIELTVYVGNSTPETMKILEFVEAQKTQPNAMAVVSSAHATEVEGMTNVIIDYIAGYGHHYECGNFVLDDWYDWYSPVNFTALNGSYSRSNVGGLNSVCMPFELTSSNIPENSKIMLFSYTNEAHNEVYFTSFPEISAGQACLMECPNDASVWNVTFDNTEISASLIPSALVGTYQERIIGTGFYKVSEDGTLFNHTVAGSSTFPFRCYLDLSATEHMGASAPALRIVFEEDGVEAITDIVKTTENNAKVYGIDGIQRGNVRRGLNIIQSNGITKKIYK